MIVDPPGDPTTISRSPAESKTRVGAIELRGRLPDSTRLAAGRPSRSGVKAKSVSWLLSRKPRTISREPKAPSMLEVKLTALPAASTMLIWLVEGRVGCGCGIARAAYVGSASCRERVCLYG